MAFRAESASVVAYSASDEVVVGVGTGLSEETRRVILRELQATGRKTSPFVPAPMLRDHFGELRTDLPPQWVRPSIVVEVEYKERTSDGLRHAMLRGIRSDKRAREVRSG